MQWLSVAQRLLHPYKDIYFFIIRWGGVIKKPYKLRVKTRALSFEKGIFCCCKQRRRNQQRNKQKTRKCASDMKKPKNVDVLTKATKRNAWWFFSVFCQKWNAATMFFVILDRTGRSFVKWLLWQCFLDSFVFFVVKRWDIMQLFYRYARYYIHLIGKLESEATKGWKIYGSKGER